MSLSVCGGARGLLRTHISKDELADTTREGGNVSSICDGFENPFSRGHSAGRVSRRGRIFLSRRASCKISLPFPALPYSALRAKTTNALIAFALVSQFHGAEKGTAPVIDDSCACISSKICIVWAQKMSDVERIKGKTRKTTDRRARAPRNSILALS